MSQLVKYLKILLIVTFSASAADIKTVVIRGNDHSTCPSQTERQQALGIINTIINLTLQTINLPPWTECGPGLWMQVASLNMSDPSQQCPSAWMEFSSAAGVRACGIPRTSGGSCPGISYATGRQYSRVCGRAIGYQFESTDAFAHQTIPVIDYHYVYGISITHGTPRNHIWTYAAGLSEGGYDIQKDNCPCSNPAHPDNAYPPSFVGDNYYCESGNPSIGFTRGLLYSDDPIWDGQLCEAVCCGNGKSPPWFSVELPNPTSDTIEVRICSAVPDNDNTPIQLLELYIQ